ncbi:dehydrogenase [Paenibacillus beijingensis]|uniref:Dehydrogenase n=1 Tax=Paenibacillus beijingensis TaxID=1126833 RepID=A0A0D5NL16_9BACL|nr:dehydrogenase [Paenibacillus beijingensis]AJY75682.1 dehydrogenase [Paenibacillus beijingensis]
MNPSSAKKHQPDFPTARKIRRACGNELYRTAKRMKVWIAADAMEEAEKRYTKKVLLNLPWIVENRSNRKLLSDWWDENVAAEIAELWNVDRTKLCAAFRDAFGG